MKKLFDDTSKDWLESSKYDAQQSIFEVETKTEGEMEKESFD